MMTFCPFLGLLMVIGWSGPALSAGISAPSLAGPCRIGTSDLHFDQRFVMDEFQIRYTNRGPDALADRRDQDRDGTPDAIQDLAAQLVTARDFFEQALHLRSPLRQARYARARAIIVTVRNMPKGNGMAFDEVTRPGTNAPMSDCALSIAVNGALSFDRNPTPAHELFHLYQYGYAFFKRGWYLEGMARWVEHAFAPTRPTVPVANGRPSCAAIFDTSYQAATYWRGLAAGRPAARAPDALMRRHYANGRPILNADGLPGGTAIRPMLDALMQASDRLTADAGMIRYAVPEQVQRSAAFDARICAAAEQAVARH